MFQLYLHRSFLGLVTAVLSGGVCDKGCKKRTPSFVAFADTQVNCLVFSLLSFLCACVRAALRPPPPELFPPCRVWVWAVHPEPRAEARQRRPFCGGLVRFWAEGPQLAVTGRES